MWPLKMSNYVVLLLAYPLPAYPLLAYSLPLLVVLYLHLGNQVSKGTFPGLLV